MKTNIQKIAGIFILGMFINMYSPSFAQEAGFMLPDSEYGNDDTVEPKEAGNSYTTDPEKKKTDKQEKEKQVPAKKALKADHSTSKKTVSEELDKSENSTSTSSGYHAAQRDEDSVLSFNFLYYMIQKFKFSDVVIDE